MEETLAITDEEKVGIAELRSRFDVASLSPLNQRFFAEPSTLIRYLRAREHHVSRAESLLQASFVWRDNDPPSLIPTSAMLEDILMGKMFMVGKDKTGRPVVVFRPSRDVDAVGTLETKVRYFVWVIEYCLARMAQNVYQMVWIIDMNGYSIGPSDLKRASLAKALLETLQNQYPERVNKLIVVSPPWYFRFLFAVLKPVLSQKTLDKVLMDNGEKDSTTGRLRYPILEEFIDLDQLDAPFGGTIAEVDHSMFATYPTPQPVL